ncbi:hypothetical protein [uncultured Shewanella sp.]|uniref:hypothetical protein n=1 Tax=uncultured Shewanella sp. TaxID=173975 RepID=UPI00261FEBD4|nr:hypothetical protein [uncultured Shewanella sp.]
MVNKEIIISSDNVENINSFINGWITFNGMYISSSKVLDMYYRMGGEIPSHSEGRYTICKRSGKFIELYSDPMGQDLLFYYISESYWVISNSYNLIIKNLKKKSIKLTLSISSSQAFFLPGGHGNQLISNSTLCQEVNILGIDNKLHIDLKTKKIKIIDCNHQYKSTTPQSDEGISIINQWLSIWISFIKSAVENNENINVDITGGRDSRIILALIIASKVDLNKINFISNKNCIDDFKVAKELSKEFNFKLNKNINKVKYYNIPSAEKYSLWKNGSMGVYTPVYFPAKKSLNTEFHFHGGGGELHRKVYNRTPNEQCVYWRKCNKNIKFTDQFELIESEFKKGIKDTGSHMNDSYGLDKHYFNFRNRHHFGRTWYKDIGKTTLTPLSSRLLYSLKINDLDSEVDDDFLIAIILMYASKKLLTMPFDKVEKSISSNAIKQASMYIKNLHLNIEKVQFYDDYDVIEKDCVQQSFEAPKVVRSIMEKELQSEMTKELYCSYFSQESYSDALNDISNENISIKESCKKASFVLSISETLMD